MKDSYYIAIVGSFANSASLNEWWFQINENQISQMKLIK